MGKINIFMHGLPVKITGKDLKPGDHAPDFMLTGNSLEPVKLGDFSGKVLLILTVPSLDTPTCSLETRRFNAEASKLGDDVVVLTVSKDLPFAQARFREANNIERVIAVSDYKNLGFAQDYGVSLEDLGLLTRAVFLVDKEGIIKYIQFVGEVTQEPNYEEVIEATNKLINQGGK